jgi:gamma-glutamyltranspeptidase/glutathione hydrolase
VLADEGPRSAYEGTIAESMLEVMRARGGLVTRDDLAGYEARWSPPVAIPYAETHVLTRPGLAPLAEPLGRLRPLRGLEPADRALALVEALAGDAGPATHTTNLTVVDGDGSVCVLTTSLGLGSGDFLPGLDLHLNSMLGETDLLRGELEPGSRMASMMAPGIAVDSSGEVVFAAGAAGGTRLRSALVQVLAGVLDERLEVADAIARPRLHPAGRTVHLEPRLDRRVAPALEAAGWTVRAWPAQHHYFGGVSAITPSGGAGDPRRSGEARLLP